MGQNRQSKVYSNETLSGIMKQRTKGEDWSTARKKMLEEAKKRQVSARPKYREGPRPRDLANRQRRKKGCKNCPG